ncbi:MAG: hypothetical protein EZS28_031405 [Streblomastix strix]|uniref:Uncharacterized protein n=1 Tax=Streblomastix strix TaxID=222440 RepID=A0A5J4URQ9_9EUKA|nr:MAG: hypothetical protein EZS28_031405 [Streblomastix strix]
MMFISQTDQIRLERFVNSYMIGCAFYIERSHPSDQKLCMFDVFCACHFELNVECLAIDYPYIQNLSEFVLMLRNTKRWIIEFDLG